jgi:hypothetical protein
MVAINELLDYLSRRGSASARDMAAYFDVSQPTISRVISSAGNRIKKISKGRSTYYVGTRMIHGQEGPFPVYLIDTKGKIKQAGKISPVTPSLFLVESSIKLFERLEGICEGLPFFLQLMRPRGYLGRSFARMMSGKFDYPQDLRDWTDDHVLLAATIRGEDMPGNLLVGHESYERYTEKLMNPLEAVQLNNRIDDYRLLVERTLRGEYPGSSAGGEQPKFTTIVNDNGTYRHVIVKFSPVMESNDGRRWADLLICEFTALNILEENGFSVPHTELVVDDRIYLESSRFDRIAESGRLSVIDFEAINNEFIGALNSTWTEAAEFMKAKKMLSEETAEQIKTLDIFGQLIANTDCHFGNISFFMNYLNSNEYVFPYSLAPVYDMLPMLYRPINGEIVTRTYKAKIPNPENVKIWRRAANMASAFWAKVAENKLISEDMRSISRENRHILDGAYEATNNIISN